MDIEVFTGWIRVICYGIIMAYYITEATTIGQYIQQHLGAAYLHWRQVIAILLAIVMAHLMVLAAVPSTVSLWRPFRQFYSIPLAIFTLALLFDYFYQHNRR